MEKALQMSGQEYLKLNAVRVIIVLVISFGYASTMPIGPGHLEKFAHLGIDPSWLGIQVLFFLSGFLALRSLWRHGSGLLYLKSRFIRNIPLLAVVTLIAVLFLYPVFGTPPANTADMIKTLGLYFLGTVSCLKPGEPLPGLLDDAKYMCLIQGAIWTLKWGVVAHIASVTGHALGILRHKSLVLVLAVLSAITYFALGYAKVKLGVDIHDSLLLANRLAWPFLAGMAVFAYKDHITQNTARNVIAALLFFAVASFCYLFLSWSPAIEILLTCGWGWLALTVVRLPARSFSVLNQWPALALAIYLINWPTAQILLLVMPEITPWQLIGLALPLTTFLAAIAHYLVSGPAYKTADKLSMSYA